MNRIYRVIYNQAKNCYVVTSEFARAHKVQGKPRGAWLLPL